MKTFFIEVTKRNSGEKYEEPSAHRQVCHRVCLRHEGDLTKKVIIIKTQAAKNIEYQIHTFISFILQMSFL